MKWQSAPIKVVPRGAVQRRVVFAFLPHDAEDGQTYWLCDIVKVEAAVSDHYDGLVWQHQHYEPCPK